MKKNVLQRSCALLLTLVMVLALTACGGNAEKPPAATPSATPTPDAAKPEYTLKMSGTVTEDHLVTKTARYFQSRVEELSNGRIKIDFYPANQLGDPRAMLEATIMGNNDILECGLPQYAQFTNQLKFLNMPFMWDSRDAAYGFVATDMGKEISKNVEEEVGVHILGFIDNGMFGWTSNKEMKEPKDAKGFKIRCQESDVLLQIWTDLGASPLPMSFTEVYTALQQGAIDGQMNGYITNYNSGYFEVQDYINVCGILFDVCPLSINLDLYNSMPDDLKAALDQAGADMQAFCIENARTENLASREGCIEKGMKMNDMLDDAAREPWIAATQKTYDWARKSFPEVDWDGILAAADELNTKYASVEEVF